MFIPKGYTIIPVFQIIKHLGLLNTRTGVILAESSGATGTADIGRRHVFFYWRVFY